jgi:hypothetical protein
MNRTTIGDFQKALTLFFIEVTLQHDLALEAVDFAGRGFACHRRQDGTRIT